MTRWTLLVCATACQQPAAEPAGQTTPTPPGIDLRRVEFDADATQQRFFAAVDAVVVPDTWYRHHARRMDGTVAVRWCSPAVPQARCGSGSVVQMTEPGVGWREVTASPHQDGGPVSILGGSAGDTTRDEGWWAAAEWREGAGGGLWIGVRHKDGRVLPLADAVSWTIDGVRLALPPSDPTAYAPDRLSHTAATRLHALESAAAAELDKGTDRCVPDRPSSPEAHSTSCTPRPLSELARAQHAEQLSTTLAMRRAALHDHSAAIGRVVDRVRPR